MKIKNRGLIVLLLLVGVLIGLTLSNYLNTNYVVADDLRLDDEEATIRAIQKVIPAVVSITVSDFETQFIINDGNITSQRAMEQQGGGTGFLISSDGYILTNKHVVGMAKKETGEYRVELNSGKKYYAQYIGVDPLFDLAVLKIFDKDLPYVEIGNSDDLKLGTTVIAIGNALGRYQNSVTKGIISGLNRNLIASNDDGRVENLNNVIQTDAEINTGNSGGPLVDLQGRVIGVNVAIDEAGSSIGFTIPINDAQLAIDTIRNNGRIVRPRLGLHYMSITPELATDRGLSRDDGALVVAGDGYPAVFPDSPAAIAGIQEGDIIFEVNAIKVTVQNSLLSIVQKYRVGQKIGLKIQRDDEVIVLVVLLDEFK